MASRAEGVWLIVIADNYIDETGQERRIRLKTGRCCWHCRYYIRPNKGSTVDGPMHCICTIDRIKNVYKVYGDSALGEKNREPDYFCARFEMDVPHVKY